MPDPWTLQGFRPTGRSDHEAQVKPLPRQHPPLGAANEPALDPERPPAMTFTAVNARSTLLEPHPGHVRPSPASYADMDMRVSKDAPQSLHTKS